MKKAIFLVCIFFVIALQGQKISGKVVDTYTGKSLKGVEVSVNNGQSKTKTNRRGSWKIVAEETDTLTFSLSGYYPESVTVGTGKKFSVGLTEKGKERKEVQIGYGSENSKRLTSAVTVLEEKDFNQGAVTDIYQLLRGKVPGLKIIHNDANPNLDPIIQLRGATSLDNNSGVLVVVDGIQGVSISSIDPNDVASVTVLKDGSAQAMYGSQANGGVLLIRTKKR